jgi:hypothetical protein
VRLGDDEAEAHALAVPEPQAVAQALADVVSDCVTQVLALVLPHALSLALRVPAALLAVWQALPHAEGVGLEQWVLPGVPLGHPLPLPVRVPLPVLLREAEAQGEEEGEVEVQREVEGLGLPVSEPVLHGHALLVAD